MFSFNVVLTFCAVFFLALTSFVLPSTPEYLFTISSILVSIPASLLSAFITLNIPDFLVSASAFVLCFSRLTNLTLSAWSPILASIWVSKDISFNFSPISSANLSSFLTLNFILDFSSLVKLLLSIKSNTSFLDLFSPFILYSLFCIVPLTISLKLRTWPGPTTSPIASSVASPKSISCSAPIWPPISPTKPPPVSIAVSAAIALRNLPALFNVLPTPLDIPKVIASIAPIFLPLAADLSFIFLKVSVSSITALMFSFVNFTPSPTSSWIKSISVKPVSIAPTKPAIPPPTAPAPAAVPATSSDCKEVSIVVALPTKSCGKKPMLSFKANKVPTIPPPFAFWSLAKLACSFVGPYLSISALASKTACICSSETSLPSL